MIWQPIETAPTDGRDIMLLLPGKRMVKAHYYNCEWLREDAEMPNGLVAKGDPNISDCWRTEEQIDDIELDVPVGWQSINIDEAKDSE